METDFDHPDTCPAIDAAIDTFTSEVESLELETSVTASLIRMFEECAEELRTSNVEMRTAAEEKLQLCHEDHEELKTSIQSYIESIETSANGITNLL